MSKNLTRKGLALGTALAFVVTGFTGIAPASAAAGDVVSIAPTTGTGYGVYNSDYINIDTSIDTDVVTSSSYSKLAIKLDNAGKVNLSVKLVDGLADVAYSSDSCVYTLPVTYSDDLGNSFVPTGGNAVKATIADAGSALSSDADCTGATYGPAAAVFTLDFTSGHGSSSDYTHAVLDLVNVEGTSAQTLSVKAADDGTDNNSVAVTSWIDSDEDEVLESTDKFPSKTETATFYDPTQVTVTPRIERFFDGSSTWLNAHGDGDLGVSLAFSPALNLDQVALSNFTFTSTEDGVAFEGDQFTEKYLDGETTHSASGRIYGVLDEDSGTAVSLAKDSAYAVSVARAVTATTAGYTVSGQASTTDNITTAGTTAVDNLDNSSQSTTTIGLRAGTKTFKYTMTANAEKAGVATFALVTATDLATGATLSVAGKTLSEGQSALIAGSTDAKGEYSVSVTASAASDGEDYTVKFYVRKVDGTYNAGSTYTATYAKAAPTTAAVVDEIIAGATATAKITVKDQFGAAVSTTSAGTALVAKFAATNTDNLLKYVPVVAGAASASFTNYLAVGSNDSITVTIGTGTGDDWATESLSDSLSLYNPESAAAINVDASLADQAITYDAFITGTASGTNVAPLDEDAIEYVGSVVDSLGTGIPGAVVTVSGAGLQFQNDATSGDYFKESITLAADAAGAFDLNVWAHKVSSAGITITVTSGGKTASTKLTTVANGSSTGASADNGDVTAADLVFSWNAPATVAHVDSTYIVTAKVEDKWGNPVSGANIDFSADGALQVNSLDAVSNKLTNASGIVRVYVRSLAKTLGVGTITATLDELTIAGTNLTDLDVSTTSAEEDILSSDLEVRLVPKATIVKAKNSSALVKNAEGRSVTIVRGTKSATKVATSESFKITVKGGTGTVKVYVDDVKVASK